MTDESGFIEWRIFLKIVRLDNAPHFIPTVAGWLYDEWGLHLPDGSPSRAEEFLKTVPDNTGLPVSFLALCEGEPAGIARLIDNDMETRPDLSPWLASVYVPVKFRGKGFGTRLCSRIVGEAGHMGFTSIYLFTNDGETFYARQGWKVIERLFYRDREATVMRIDTYESMSKDYLSVLQT